MPISLQTSLLSDADFLPSAHCDERPSGTNIDLIVIHNISLPAGEFATGVVAKFFCGELDFDQYPSLAEIREMRVAAHLFIDRLGKATQFVPFVKRAWHAGVSSFQGRERCNDFSIGIELEGTDYVPFEDVQYHTLAKVIVELQQAYPAITRDRIVGHSDIAPGRKTDPGPFFDWNKLHCLL